MLSSSGVLESCSLRATLSEGQDWSYVGPYCVPSIAQDTAQCLATVVPLRWEVGEGGQSPETALLEPCVELPSLPAA